MLTHQSVLLQPATDLLSGWHWVGSFEPSCTSQVASVQGFQRDLLAVELEALLGYQVGHTAFLMSPVTEVDLEVAERVRCDLLLVSVPVHQLIMTVMDLFDMSKPLQEEHGLPPVSTDPSWMDTNPYLQDRKMRSLNVDIP